MGMFRDFGRSFRVRHCSDTFSLAVESKFHGIADAIHQRNAKDGFLLLVAHFPETFFQMQDALGEASISYDIVDAPVDPSVTARWQEDSNREQVYLTLANFLEPEPQSSHRPRNRESSIIVAERHPLPSRDKQIAKFAGNTLEPIRLGYFLALRDPAVAPFLGEWAELVLKQLGMDDHELITSQLVSRRLEFAYRKIEYRLEDEIEADSQSEWLEANARWLPKRKS